MRVETGCRDCAMCTGHAFTGFGRTWGRGIADLATLGVTNLARKKCRGCAHPMVEHGHQMQVGPVRQQPEPQQQQQQPQPQPQQPPPPVVPAGWYPVPQDPRHIMWWDGRWYPESQRLAQPQIPRSLG